MDNGLSAEQIEASIQKLLLNWNQSKTELEELFKKRESEQALSVMKNAVELFIEFLSLTNGKGSDNKFNIEDCGIRPVNLKERLDFIVSRPQLYHSYIQLSELYAEQNKQYAKQVALNKIKQNSPD